MPPPPVGLSSFRDFPSRESRTPLGAASSPAVIHRRLETNRPHPSAPISSTPTLARSRLSPPDAYGALSTGRNPLPGRRGHEQPKPPRTASFTRFEALLLSRVRSRHAELPRRNGRSSPGLNAPLKPSPSSPRPSDPPRPRGPEHAHHPKDPGTTRRTLRPLGPGEPLTETNATAQVSSADSSPLRDWPAPPLDGVSSPMALNRRANPTPLTFGALKCEESGVSPQRSPAPLGFPASSATS